MTEALELARAAAVQRTLGKGQLPESSISWVDEEGFPTVGRSSLRHQTFRDEPEDTLVNFVSAGAGGAVFPLGSQQSFVRLKIGKFLIHEGGWKGTTDANNAWRVMSAISFALFESPIGSFAIAWGVRGIFTIQLPEPGERETSARLIRRFPGVREAPAPADIQRAGEAIQALLRGEPSDLSFIELDLSSVPAFHQRVYAVARTIPPGTTITYGDLAKQLGEAGLARTVGQALGRNPFALVVPCHRILAAQGKLGGFSASGGVRMKQQLLRIEGADAGGSPGLFD